MAAPTYRSHTAQRNESATASATVAVPAGVVDGDIILLLLNKDALSDEPPTWPAGFSTVVSTDTAAVTGSPDQQAAWIALKVASSESGNYVPTWGVSRRNTLIAVAVQNASSSGVLSSSKTSTATETNLAVTATATAITTVSADNYILNFTASDDTGNMISVTEPASYTERYDSAGGTSNGCEFSDIAQASAGTTGAVTSTINFSGSNPGSCWIVLMLALVPASGNIAWLKA